MDIPEESLSFLRVRPEHLAGIIALAESYSLHEMTAEKADKYGFLVSDSDLETYRDLQKRADLFFLARFEEEIAAFILAYTSDKIQPDEWLNLEIKRRYQKEFVLLKQVCVDLRYAGMGLATRLYEYLFTKTGGLPLLGAIVLQPLNQRSIAFHEHLGFNKYFEATPPDGLPRGVWLREESIRSHQHSTKDLTSKE